MTDTLDDIALPRPPAAARPGRLDDRLYDLVESRFRRILRANPVAATFLGIHTEDHRLPDGSREAVLAELEADKAHMARVEALDPRELSDDARFERDLELHNLRLQVFETEVIRTWERRSTALETIGDAIFLLFARDSQPLPERLVSIAARLDQVPTFLERSSSRAAVPQVRLWQQLEIESARDLPFMFEELRRAGETALGDADRARLGRAIDRATTALREYSGWLTGGLARGTDEWALGRARYDELIALRAFDGLTADGILEIGQEMLHEHRRLRRDAAIELDPNADEPSVIERIKAEQPPDFEAALAAYRDAMYRSRTHLIERRLVTVPDDERLEVLPTPTYLRMVIPFAAYIESPPFEHRPLGLYIVTPSVDGDSNAMREHNLSSISNTSIHEAYPGHHLQLTIGGRNPSLSRLLTNAPEFVEGWGMYSEQLMRDHGFDDAPKYRVMMHTDAIWRACRIILDIRMHRGEVTPEEAVDFLVEHTAFEEPNARAEVKRYTYTPTYQLSYLLGKVLILGLREDERRRRGVDFRLQDFHDALLNAGSLPISFHRRLLERDAVRSAGGGRRSGETQAAAC
jgi:uncharacterized protein (DUF885 family)